MSAVAWSADEWEEWSNDLADALPERYDGDAAQEAIILDAVKDMAARLDLIRAILGKDLDQYTYDQAAHKIRDILQ